MSDATLLNFTPTALYTLSEPGMPQSLREYAVSQARDGEEVTAVMVTGWLSAMREAPPPDLKPRALAAIAPDDEELEPNPVDPADVFARNNWFALRELVGPECIVHLSGLPDSENNAVSYAGVRIDGATGKVTRATGGTVEQVVLLLSGAVRKKRCAKSGESKPLDDYCKPGDLYDGREYRCKVREWERVKGGRGGKLEQERRSRGEYRSGEAA